MEIGSLRCVEGKTITPSRPRAQYLIPATQTASELDTTTIQLRAQIHNPHLGGAVVRWVGAYQFAGFEDCPDMICSDPAGHTTFFSEEPVPGPVLGQGDIRHQDHHHGGGVVLHGGVSVPGDLTCLTDMVPVPGMVN